MEFMTSITGGVDELKPSLFEILSEQQLAALLPPSLRYLLALATHRHPRYLIRILNNFDEVYALLQLLIERHFLQAHLGTFTENFYGLKRERVLRLQPPHNLGHALPRAQLAAPGDVRDALRLRPRDVWANLLVSVGVPYLKRKLDESYDIHAAPRASAVLGPAFANRDALPDRPTLSQRFLHAYKWFLRRIYPSVNAAYYFALLAFQLAYLFDASRFHDPFLWLIGSRVRRLAEADHRAAMQAEAAVTATAARRAAARPGLAGATSLLNPRVLFSEAGPRLLSGLRFLLPTSIFALKFLEWWHASDFARQLARKASEGLELPPPNISAQLPPLANGKPASPPARNADGESPDAPRSALKGSSPPRPSDSAVRSHPVSTISGLPILTVPAHPPPPQPDVIVESKSPPVDEGAATALCPICGGPIQTPTATPYGYVFCYQCIHRWVEGTHERQERFMAGAAEEEFAWDDDSTGDEDSAGAEGKARTEGSASREGRWESGKGRCAVTGLRILGETGGLRRVMA